MNAPSSSFTSGAGRSMNDFTSLVELLNMNTRSLMQRSIREIDVDYERTLEKLERAEAEGTYSTRADDIRRFDSLKSTSTSCC
jgi:hypothetical protein